MKRFELVDPRPAYDKAGKIVHMVTSGGYVMVKRPRCAPFVLTLKEWAKLSKEPAAAPPPPVATRKVWTCQRCGNTAAAGEMWFSAWAEHGRVWCKVCDRHGVDLYGDRLGRQSIPMTESDVQIQQRGAPEG